jgi:hypothetical protein
MEFVHEIETAEPILLRLNIFGWKCRFLAPMFGTTQSTPRGHNWPNSAEMEFFKI